MGGGLDAFPEEGSQRVGCDPVRPEDVGDDSEDGDEGGGRGTVGESGSATADPQVPGAGRK